ncbi:hypothetical protein FNU76_15175 [Chitinimonas arctica]|uniref:Uncharacterized protein n=1 Tax=Chitinimonas arctica TaxID=2594795 RepID=A0A516SHH0_9NEIS|nr:hypothetical protein [Chitinimonas arctica]QDQ27587.1 hypothetical protein FNU76_15175 [Chitinimonas arctica]
MNYPLRALLGASLCITLAACGGGSGDDAADREMEKEIAKHPEWRQYTPMANIDAMIKDYKKLKEDKSEAVKIRPKLLATVIGVNPLDKDQGPALAKEFGLIYRPELLVAAVYTPKGWTMLAVKSGMNLKEGDVLEIDLPAANDFSDLEKIDTVTKELDALKADGSVGIRAVHPECKGENVSSAEYTLTCNGIAAPYFHNESEFPKDGMGWVTADGKAPEVPKAPERPEKPRPITQE